MTQRPQLSFILFGALGVSWPVSTPAQTYRCDINGEVVYQQVPCTGGARQREIGPVQRQFDASKKAQPLAPSSPASPSPYPGNFPPVAVGWVQVPPAPSSPSDYAPRTRDLITFVRKHPAAPRTSTESPLDPVGGVQFWPSVPTTAEALAILDDERAPFDASALASWSCRPGFRIDAKVQVVRVTANNSGVTLPVFLAPDADALRYLEVSLDIGTYPILLQIVAENGAAVRVTTSAQTRLLGVQINSRFPSLVLGVAPQSVASRYEYGVGLPKCSSSGIIPASTAGIVPHRVESPSRIVVGEPQIVRRLSPQLGQFVDHDAPLPSSYGLALLKHFGYARSIAQVEGLTDMRNLVEVLKPFRIPEGLAGAHSVNFVVRRKGPVPTGNPSHSQIWQEAPPPPPGSTGKLQ